MDGVRRRRERNDGGRGVVLRRLLAGQERPLRGRPPLPQSRPAQGRARADLHRLCDAQARPRRRGASALPQGARDQSGLRGCPGLSRRGAPDQGRACQGTRPSWPRSPGGAARAAPRTWTSPTTSPTTTPARPKDSAARSGQATARPNTTCVSPQLLRSISATPAGSATGAFTRSSSTTTAPGTSQPPSRSATSARNPRPLP